MIFGPVKKWMFNTIKLLFHEDERDKITTWIFKPLFNCPVCMSSVWGSVMWFSWGDNPLWQYPFFLVCLSGCIFIVLLLCNEDPRSNEQ
jgi:hypothetical protein